MPVIIILQQGHLLEKIRKNDKIIHPEHFDDLKTMLNEINKMGTFNAIFSDGRYLFCYHDVNRYKGLSFLKRSSTKNKVKLLDNDWEIDLADEKSPDESGYIIATRPLTNEKDWRPFDGGELKIFNRGELIYPKNNGNI